MTESEIEAVGQPAVSQIPINDLVRVLRGMKRKYTVRVLMRCGTELEFQTDSEIKIEWCQELRASVLKQSNYKEDPILIPWSEVLVFRQETNPE